jgi:hypothetical protein
MEFPPNPSPSLAELLGVAAISGTETWAVGDSIQGDRNQTLAEPWDGSTWTVVPTPGSTYGSSLAAVDGASSADVWAVGVFSDIGALIEHWNGSAWRVANAPPTGIGGYLYGVRALSTGDVWAVGGYFPVSPYVEQALLEHWDGSVWSIVPAPLVADRESLLYSVSAATPTDIWAVGSSFTDVGGSSETLTEHWDGASWTVVASPNSGTQGDTLFGVAAISSTQVWAGGHYFDGTEEHAEALAWDGTNWRSVPVQVQAPESYLRAMTKVGRRAIGVGFVSDYLGDAAQPLLVSARNGATRHIAIPSSRVISVLFAVSATEGQVVAAGFVIYENGGVEYPFVERRCA